MNEDEIIKKWGVERPAYTAWAYHVLDKISSGVTKAIAPIALHEFVKVPVVPRLKDSKSLIDKALYRSKNYADPYEDITDKVGIRFVVLLTSDIKKVEEIICASDAWEQSKDRDYEDERKSRPMEFAYQSVHYVVRAISDLEINGVLVKKGTTCEIQVRTLLQHAHSELTHDSIYKPKRSASPEVQRIVATSMALIEATDDYFERVVSDLSRETEGERNAIYVLNKIYFENLQFYPESQKINLLIADAYSDKINDDLEAQVRELINSKPFIIDKIAERSASQHLYRQAIILLVYTMASLFPAETKSRWPLTEDELRPVYRDIGLSIDNFN